MAAMTFFKIYMFMHLVGSIALLPSYNPLNGEPPREDQSLHQTSAALDDRGVVNFIREDNENDDETLESQMMRSKNGNVGKAVAEMEKFLPSVHAHSVQPEGVPHADNKGGKEPSGLSVVQMDGGHDGRVSMPIPQGYLQLELSLVGQLRSYMRGVSTSNLALVAVLAFVMGVLTSVFMVSFLTKPSQPESTEDAKTFTALVDETFTALVDEGVNLLSAEPEDVGPLPDPKFDFDFETDEENKARRWEWCTPDKIEELGLLTQAPTQEYKGYKRFDVGPTHKEVEGILASAQVDFTVFDFKRDGARVLWQLLRAEAYFMLIDANLPSRKLLFMMETVRLRLSYGGQVLVQKCDKSVLAPESCLPVSGKPASESPVSKARKMWQEDLQMPLDIADFIEASTVDHTIAGYNGLHCVERCHIIDVKLRPILDNEVLSKLGLPMHQDFSCSDPHDEEGRGEEERNFTWFTTQECKASGMIMGSGDGESSCVLDFAGVDGPAATCDTKLKEFLQNAQVDVDSPKWQSVFQQLAKELASGTCSITQTSKGVNRCVNVVALRLWNPDRTRMLIEKGSKHNVSGEEEWNARLPGVKFVDNETVTSAAIRVCEERLGLQDGDVDMGSDATSETFAYFETSSRYVGLLTKYQKFFVDLVLDDDEELLKRLGLDDYVDN